MANRQEPIPLYYQIELRLREAIASGRYGPGDRLPPEIELQREFKVSRVTVRTALGRLEADDLVFSQRGRGTFVTQAAAAARGEPDPRRLLAFEDDLISRVDPPRVDWRPMDRSPLPARMAALLGVSPGIETVRHRLVGWVGPEPLWLESRYIHPDLIQDYRPSASAGEAVAALMQPMMKQPVVGGRIRISAGTATRAQAGQLHINAGDPILVNEFALYRNGHPVEAAKAVFRADRYALTADLTATSRIAEFPSVPEGTSGTIGVIRQEIAV